MKIISTDKPLSELILRRYEKPYNLTNREIIRKLCLSIGILQPGDSRDVIVDIFHALLIGKSKRQEMTVPEIVQKVKDLRKEEDLAMLGIAESNVRRQIKRLKDLFIIEKVGTKYRITEFDKLDKIFTDRIEEFILKNTVERVKDYLRKANELYTEE